MPHKHGSYRVSFQVSFMLEEHTYVLAREWTRGILPITNLT